MGPQRMLTKEEEFALCEYIEEMVEQKMSFTPIQVKIKVEQMI